VARSVAACALIVAVATALMLARNHGHFFYPLDDPYIHLRVAQRIARGGYGINAGEFSSPSSSVLWPFVLAPFAWLPLSLFVLVPFVLDVGLVLGETALIYAILARVLTAPGEARVRPVMLTIVIIVACNVIGVALTGLEHSLQGLLTLLIVRGLVILTREDRLDRWLLVGIALLPLVRFEGALISLSAVAFAWSRGRPITIVPLALGGLGVVAFGAWLMSHGLPPLPSSVLVKIATRVPRSFVEHSVPAIIVVCLLPTLRPAWRLRAEPRRALPYLLPVATVIVYATQMIFVAWYGRYEVFLFLYVLGLLLALFPDACRALLTRGPLHALRSRRALLYGGGILATIYTLPLVGFPIASHDIMLQPAEVARFTRQLWRRPVAIDDLGLASLGADAYVLDLLGLGSDTARRALSSPAAGPQLVALAKRQHVDLAAIYAFPNALTTEQGWLHIADLTVDTTNFVLPVPTVQIWTRDAATAAEAHALLRQFARALPAEVRLTVANR
jgi:hypothetical protein